jgi:hypothetical protein
MAQGLLAFFDGYADEMSRLRGPNAGGFFAENPDRFETAKAAALRESDALMTSADADRKAVVGEVTEMVVQHGKKVSWEEYFCHLFFGPLDYG